MKTWMRSLITYYRPRPDAFLGVVLLLVVCFGLLVLYSASGGRLDVIWRQSARLIFGLSLMLLLSRVSPATLRLVTPFLFAGSLAMVVWVAVAGVGQGANRWLDLKWVRFQPAELLKLTLPMMLAWYLHERPIPIRFRDIVVSAVFIAVPTVLVARQPDLGTALLIAGSGGAVLFLAGMRWKLMLGMVLTAVAMLPLLWSHMHEYQRNRVRILLNPESDPLNHGWNIIQSKIAIGSGGLYGKGWHHGTQAQLDFIPERSTDFIMAVLGEEFGLMGVLLLLTTYLLIISRVLRIAANGADNYSRLLAGSIGLTFTLYVVVNTGMVSGLLPVVGVPLPLVSYGGTSVVTLLAGFGMVMAVKAHSKRGRFHH